MLQAGGYPPRCQSSARHPAESRRTPRILSLMKPRIIPAGPHPADDGAASPGVTRPEICGCLEAKAIPQQDMGCSMTSGNSLRAATTFDPCTPCDPHPGWIVHLYRKLDGRQQLYNSEQPGHLSGNARHRRGRSRRTMGSGFQHRSRRRQRLGLRRTRPRLKRRSGVTE